MSPAYYNKTTTKVVKLVTATITITTTEVITVTPCVTALDFIPNERAHNPNNRPDSSSPYSKPNCTLSTSDSRCRRVFKLPNSEPGSMPGLNKEHFRKRKHDQENEPFLIKTGLRGRPKELPNGTMEWVKLSQDKDMFCHPTDPNERHVSFNDALPPSFFRMDAKNSNAKCKFQISYFALARYCLF